MLCANKKAILRQQGCTAHLIINPFAFVLAAIMVGVRTVAVALAVDPGALRQRSRRQRRAAPLIRMLARTQLSSAPRTHRYSHTAAAPARASAHSRSRPNTSRLQVSGAAQADTQKQNINAECVRSDAVCETVGDATSSLWHATASDFAASVWLRTLAQHTETARDHHRLYQRLVARARGGA